jgi:hypothetical protein
VQIPCQKISQVRDLLVLTVQNLPTAVKKPSRVLQNYLRRIQNFQKEVSLPEQESDL